MKISCLYISMAQSRNRTKPKQLSLKLKRVVDEDSTMGKQLHKTSALVVPKLKSEVIKKLKDVRANRENVNDERNVCKLDPEGSTEYGNGAQDLRGGEIAEGGLGDLVFCHICQRDLTRMNATRRQQHMNRCCDAAAMTPEGNESEQNSCKVEHSCLICKKKFNDEQVKTAHLKSCAKRKGLTTTELLELVNQHSNGGSDASTKRQVSLKYMLQKPDDDFRAPPPDPPRPKRSRKRRSMSSESLQDVKSAGEYEQLQLALALSASLEREVPGSGDIMMNGATKGAKGRKRLKRKHEGDVVPPLLTVTTEQAHEIIALRAEQLLRPSAPVSHNQEQESQSEDEIPCTPTFGSSDLAKEVAPPSNTPPLPTISDTRENEDILFTSDAEESDPVHPEDTEHSRLTSGKPKSKGSNKETQLNESDGDLHACGPNTDRCEPANNIETSFMNELQDLNYPTLWQLGSSKLTSNKLGSFYVPALSSMVSPSKSKPLSCKQCSSDVCCLMVQDTISAPTLPKQLCTHGASPAKEKYKSEIDSLLSDLHSMIDSSFLSDITISVQDGSPINAHSCILAARCPGFKNAMATKPVPPKWFDLSVFPRESVLAYLEYVYAGSIPHNNEHIKEDFKAISLRMSSRDLMREHLRYNDDSDDTTMESSSDPNSSIPSTLIPPDQHTSDKDDEVVLDISSSKSHDTSSSKSHDLDGHHTPVKGNEVVSDTSSSKSSHDLEGHHTPIKDDEFIPYADSPKVHDHDTSIRDNELILHTEEWDGVMDREVAYSIEISSVSNEMDSNEHVTKMSYKGDKSELRYVLISSSSSGSDVVEGILISPSSSNSDVMFCGYAPSQCTATLGTSSGAKDVVELEEGYCDSNTSGSDETKEQKRDIIITGYEERRDTDVSDHTKDGHRTEVHETDIDDASSMSMNVCRTNKAMDTSRVADIGDGGEETAVGTSDSEDAIDIGMSVVTGSVSELGENEGNWRREVDLGEDEGTIDLNKAKSIPRSDVNVDTDKSIVEEVCFHQDVVEIGVCDASFNDEYDLLFEGVSGNSPMPTKPPETALLSISSENLPSKAHEPITPALIPTHQSFITPAAAIGKPDVLLLSDDNITPMPDYRDMHTPQLRGACAKFGLKPLPKRKMISKLTEIYTYTHPLVDEDGCVIPEGGQNEDKSLAAPKTKPQDLESIRQHVKDFIMSDKELFQDILLYKPLEISLVQAKLKAAGLGIAKDKLADILDFMCVTLTEPRKERRKHKNIKQQCT